MGEQTSLVPAILYVLGAAGGVSALYGVWLNRRQPEANYRLITAQTETQGAERESKAVEASHKAVESLSKALDRAEAVVLKLEHAQEEWEVRERLLEKQIEDLSAQKRCAEIEVAELRSRL